MDKTLITGAVLTTGGCSVLNGVSVQQMLLLIIVLMLLHLAWQMGYALRKCKKERQRLTTVMEKILERREKHGQPR